MASDPASTIFRYAPDASRTTFSTGLNGPIGMAYDSAGNLYVASIRGNAVIKFEFYPDAKCNNDLFFRGSTGAPTVRMNKLMVSGL